MCRSLSEDYGPNHVFIQYKGTDLCADLYCECGTQWHAHGMFVYAVRCPGCGRDYELSAHIKLIPMADPPCEHHEPQIAVHDPADTDPFTGEQGWTVDAP